MVLVLMAMIIMLCISINVNHRHPPFLLFCSFKPNPPQQPLPATSTFCTNEKQSLHWSVCPTLISSASN
jgi:hypothetical protein